MVTESHGGLVCAIRDHVLHGLEYILELSGAAIAPADVAQKLSTTFGESILGLASLTIEVQKAICQDVLSSNFEVFCPKYREPFREELMTDIDGATKPSIAIFFHHHGQLQWPKGPECFAIHREFEHGPFCKRYGSSARLFHLRR